MKVNIGKYKKNGNDRNTKVIIEGHDLWSLDNTLARIIHPALVAFRDSESGGYGQVDKDDVPGEFDEDDMGFSEGRWEAALDAMIWSFAQVLDDGEWEQFIHGESIDLTGWTAYDERIQYGLNLFGKYYRGLWL